MQRHSFRICLKGELALVWITWLLLLTCGVQGLEVNSLSLNLVEKPTNNKNIFGTTYSAATGFVQTWGSNYMKYKLSLTSDPAHVFDHLYIQVVANRGNQNNDVNNSLRFALFGQDPTIGGLNESDAIAYTTINQADISPTFTNYLMGPASNSIYIDPINADPTVNEYYLMIYAGGGVANQGYGLKLDSVVREVEYYAPSDPQLVVKYESGGGGFVTSTPFTPSGTPVPVPEPSVMAFGGASIVVMLLTGRHNRRIVQKGK